MTETRAILRSALPLYVTMAVSSASALVSTALLGRHGTASLAAFAVAAAVFVPVVTAVSGVMRGMMPYVTAAHDDPAALRRVLGSGRVLGLGIGGCGALVVLATPAVARASGVDGAAVDGLGPLPLLLAAAVLAQSVGASASSALVALDRGKLVMWAGLSGTAVTVLLSALLTPRTGVSGAGIAMLASAVVVAVVAQAGLRRRTGRPGRPDRREIVTLARTGLPMAGTVLVKFAVLSVLTFAAARLGAAQAAAHGIGETLVNLIFTAAVALGQATVPRVSAGSYRAARTAAVLALIGTGTLVCVLIVAGRWIVPVFSADPRLRPDVLALLPLVGFAVVTDALQAVYGFALLGLRNTLPSLFCTLIFFGLLAVVAVPTAEHGGLPLLWTALGLANLSQAAAKAFLYNRAAGKARERPGHQRQPGRSVDRTG
ncbi:MATE family multidrug resistance protein [Actinoplanes campanulatus]|uniref:Probable multidrug resistance protein NorM n=1 Tax=Actinoplanes campanulatus TaxID=113559 RepID=A0A7W5ANJ1_9ACTN|nr:MATE family efflux transporter [Actinoplanes campanulatus]MBB3099541.1 MATE family multidrug resistance protein [Actinoplanes campanulatus]GGN42338.1 hypothetical protein GCM10010109_73380 [Actinoplanes campanulatus]GID39890.1 hypothetical protein Aca09nite_63960 [Actinoplanes campanulatus]